jgi:hypothetical protein
MKVKELIRWLKTKNPNDFIGELDYGQDSGDWMDLQKRKFDGRDMGNLKILTFNQVIKRIKKDHSKDYAELYLKEFYERYKK